MKEYKFTQHPYPVIIQFIPNERDWNRITARMGLDETYPETAGRCTIFDHKRLGTRIFITFSDAMDERPSVDAIGLMVHELTHVVQQIALTTGQAVDHETEAYLMQALIQWMLEAYSSSGRTFRDEGLNAR